MARFITFILILSLIFLVFVFTLENLALVSINFLVFKLQVPLGIIILVCFILGSLVGVAFSLSLVVKNKSRAKKLAKKVEMAEQEVANLRQLPIKSSH